MKLSIKAHAAAIFSIAIAVWVVPSMAQAVCLPVVVARPAPDTLVLTGDNACGDNFALEPFLAAAGPGILKVEVNLGGGNDTFSAMPHKGLALKIKAGPGNDNIKVAGSDAVPDVYAKVDVAGGSGNDTIDIQDNPGTVVAGTGTDTVSSGDGMAGALPVQDLFSGSAAGPSDGSPADQIVCTDGPSGGVLSFDPAEGDGVTGC